MSQKYLGLSIDEEDVENDVKFRLELTENKTYFKVIPCFQYQTKISMKIKFNEDIYLSTFVSSRNCFISISEN